MLAWHVVQALTGKEVCTEGGGGRREEVVGRRLRDTEGMALTEAGGGLHRHSVG